MREIPQDPAAMAGSEPMAGAEVRSSWAPMLLVGATQILMVFNISTLQVSIDGIVASFGTAATTVGTAIVTYSLVVAAFIMLGARLSARLGPLRVFRASVLLFGAAMGMAALSPAASVMIVAQLLAGAAAAALVPTLVVLIADNYRGRQQGEALAWLGGAQAMGLVLAFLIAGAVATWIGWRFTFALLALLALVVYWLSGRLRPIGSRAAIAIDGVGAALAAAGIVLISVGFNNLMHWGPLLAGPGAPFTVLDMSPAPVMIVAGIFLLEGFLTWTRGRREAGAATLVALEVLDTPTERSTVFSMFAIGALGSAITFLIPLYIQIVQGRSSFATAVAIVPFSLASFAAAVLVVRLRGRLSPRLIARYAFMVMAIALALLGAVIRNDWSDTMVIASMVAAGVGEGALITLLFNVLVSASPREMAGDVGSRRGAANNLAAGVGTALASTLVAGVLSTSVHRELVHDARLPDELKREIGLDSASFSSNDGLRRALEGTAATTGQVDEAVRINTEARRLALKVTFFTLAGLALLAYFPAGRLPARVRQATGREPLEIAGEPESTGSPVA